MSAKWAQKTVFGDISCNVLVNRKVLVCLKLETYISL